MFKFHRIKQFLSNWLNELAEFMDPDNTGNLFGPTNELVISGVERSNMSEVFIHTIDLFIPTDLTKKEVLKMFREDKLKPFKFVREIIEDKGIVEGIKDVNLYDTLFKGREFLLEYIVDFAKGRTAVKVIGSNNPRKMLEKYYIEKSI